ncbi:MAG: hypothetical protein ACR2NJ_12635 [Acidimicrobiales bacterium]
MARSALSGSNPTSHLTNACLMVVAYGFVNAGNFAARGLLLGPGNGP